MALDGSISVNVVSYRCEICSDIEGQDDSVPGQTGYALATMYCENCRQKLCNRCGRGHNRLRLATDHRVVELGTVSRQLDDTRGSGDSSARTCSTHNARPLELYCRDCRDMGCVLCVSLEAHQDHKWCDIDAASQEVRRSLSRDLEQVSAKLEECRHATSAHRTSADALEKSLHDARNQLCSELEKLHQDLDQCAEELQCKLEAAEQEKTKTENKCVELQEQAGRLASFVEQCQQTIDSASSIDLLRSSYQLHAAATKLVHEEIKDDLCPLLRVLFTPTNLRQYLPQTGINLVGAVFVDDADVQGEDEDENLRSYGTAARNQQKGEFNLAFHFLLLRPR